MIDGITCDGTDIVFAESSVISEEGLSVCPERVRYADGIRGRRQGSFGLDRIRGVVPDSCRSGVLMFVSVRKVMVEVQFERQSFVKFGNHERRGRTPVSIFFTITRRHILQDVVGIGVFFIRGDIAPFVRAAGIHSRDGRLQVLEAGSEIHESIVLTLSEKSCTDGKPVREFNLDIGTDIELGGSAVHAMVAHHTLVVQITDRSIGFDVIRPSGHRNIVLLHEAGMECFFKPVRIRICYAVGHAVGVEFVGIQLCVFPKGDGLVGIHVGYTDIVRSFIDKPHGLGIVRNIFQTSQIRHLCRQIVAVRDMYLACDATFGRNQDDAVCRTGTVNGS